MSNAARKTLLSLIHEQISKLPPEASFLEDYKNTISKMNPNKRGSNFYKPSSMNCDRCMYFIRTAAPVDESLPEYNSVRITECGTSSHERIQYYVSQMRDHGYDCDWIDPEWYIRNKNLKYLKVQDEEFCKEHGLTYHGEKSFETKLFDSRYNISFLCDGIIRYKGEYYILEIKTETAHKNYMRAGADIKHKNQSVSYSLSLGIDKIMWLYESRDHCTAKTYITTVSEEEKAELALRIEYVDGCVASGTIPQKCSNLSMCQYCNYKSICRKN